MEAWARVLAASWFAPVFAIESVPVWFAPFPEAATDSFSVTSANEKSALHSRREAR